MSPHFSEHFFENPPDAPPVWLTVQSGDIVGIFIGDEAREGDVRPDEFADALFERDFHTTLGFGQIGNPIENVALAVFSESQATGFFENGFDVFHVLLDDADF